MHLTMYIYVHVTTETFHDCRTSVATGLVEHRRTVDLAVTAPVGRDTVEQARELVVTAD